MKNYLLLSALIFFSAVNAQIVNIPDAKFKTKLLEADATNNIATNFLGINTKIDLNGDGEIQESEALQIRDLTISKSEISSLEGIKYFSYLEILDCRENQLTTLDVSYMYRLTGLFLAYNRLTTMNLKGLAYLNYLVCDDNLFTDLGLPELRNLKYLSFGNNKIASFDFSALTTLKGLGCGGNPLKSLDLKKLTNLEDLSCEGIGLTVLDLKGLSNLLTISCEDNNLTSLDVREATNLDWLICSNNKLKTLDLSSTNKIQTLACGGNDLTTLNIENLKGLGFFTISDSPLLESIFAKNGVPQLYSFSYYPSPNLKYICIDDNKVPRIQASLTKNGYNNCVVSSYCSFVPGGPLYSLQGKIRLDKNNNGCDASDINTSNVKFSINDGTTKGNVIANESGNYSIAVSKGRYTISPVLENPSYFTVSPTSIQTDPNLTGQFTQNFCLSPNGSYKDLEINILPVEVARPGFEANYKIIYKNKGNVTQSGIVSLDFNDSILDFVRSSSVVSSQSLNNLNWSFVNLSPFETREIKVVLKLNSPTEIPAANINDVLVYKAVVNSSDKDETPIDNVFTLSQKVVGSYDPNDKTCLEGDVITPALIGEYVHYMIRFENTGTYSAKNIVVKDMIDLSKFDISTLIPTSASHSFITKISDGNKVEFIFENVNLPFDNANNDGYIAFKIKTLPTLVVGDTFENEAYIYFDYNFPILTNKSKSTFATLGTQDFEFSNYLSVYPNPVANVLNITSKDVINVTSMAIYNILGQLIIAVPNAQNTSSIDVSILRAGNYILKVKTDKGTSGVKFVKK